MGKPSKTIKMAIQINKKDTDARFRMSDSTNAWSIMVVIYLPYNFSIRNKIATFAK